MAFTEVPGDAVYQVSLILCIGNGYRKAAIYSGLYLCSTYSHPPSTASGGDSRRMVGILWSVLVFIGRCHHLMVVGGDVVGILVQWCHPEIPECGDNIFSFVRK